MEKLIEKIENKSLAYQIHNELKKKIKQIEGMMKSPFYIENLKVVPDGPKKWDFAGAEGEVVNEDDSEMGGTFELSVGDFGDGEVWATIKVDDFYPKRKEIFIEKKGADDFDPQKDLMPLLKKVMESFVKKL